MNIFFSIVNAQDTTNTNTVSVTFSQLLYNIEYFILTPLIYLFFALALILFLYGVFEFIKNSNDPEERKKGGQHILWGVVGMAIMFSVYGLINLILNTLSDVSFGY